MNLSARVSLFISIFTPYAFMVGLKWRIREKRQTLSNLEGNWRNDINLVNSKFQLF